jgi:hypothetical protein
MSTHLSDASPQPTIMILIKRKPGLTREQFIDYYETHHVVLAKRLFGHLMVRYVRNYPHALLSYHPEDYELEASYDAVTEITLKDQAAYVEMERIHTIPENVAAIIEDEEQFQDRAKTRLLVSNRVDTGVTLLDRDAEVHEHLSHPPHSGV